MALGNFLPEMFSKNGILLRNTFLIYFKSYKLKVIYSVSSQIKWILPRFIVNIHQFYKYYTRLQAISNFIRAPNMHYKYLGILLINYMLCVFSSTKSNLLHRLHCSIGEQPARIWYLRNELIHPGISYFPDEVLHLIK